MNGYTYRNPATGSYTVFVPKDAKTGSFRKPVSAAPTVKQIADTIYSVLNRQYGDFNWPDDAAEAVASLYPTCQPSREAIADALHSDACPEDGEDGCSCANYLREADAVLALLPGRTEAEVKAEALWEAWHGTSSCDSCGHRSDCATHNTSDPRPCDCKPVRSEAEVGAETNHGDLRVWPVHGRFETWQPRLFD